MHSNFKNINKRGNCSSLVMALIMYLILLCKHIRKISSNWFVNKLKDVEKKTNYNYRTSAKNKLKNTQKLGQSHSETRSTNRSFEKLDNKLVR